MRCDGVSRIGTSIKAQSETFSLLSLPKEDEDGGKGKRLSKVVDKRWSTLSRQTTPCRFLDYRGGKCTRTKS